MEVVKEGHFVVLLGEWAGGVRRGMEVEER